MFSYIVTISDINPIMTKGGNRLQYRFPSRRKAFKFMEDAMSRGLYVSCYRENIWTDDQWEGEPNYGR